jgi:bifunctional DNA-binding transcriptional regulator/antitoxin component of YhaV-PrlF toxin-antitoxin module
MVKAAVLGVSKMTGQRWVTIPKEAREEMHVKAGGFLQYLLTEDGYALIRKIEFDLMRAIKHLTNLVKVRIPS